MKMPCFIWVLIAAFAGPSLAAKEIIRMGTLAPKGSTWHKILEQMGRDIQEATDGEVVLRIYPGGIVGGESEMIRKMRIGQLHAAAISNAGLGEIDRLAYALSLPMVFADYDEWDHVRQKVNPDLEKALLGRGFTVLAWSDIGWLYFFAKDALRLPGELKQRKLATSSSEPATSDILKWAGFNPVPITTVDMMSGLQTGLVDAFYLPAILAESSQLFRHAKNMVDLKWAPLQGALIVHEKAWRDIAPQHRQKILAIAREVGTALREQTRDQERLSLEAMTKRGLNIIELDEAARVAWVKATKEAFPQIREKLVTGELFDKILALREAYRAGKP